jgi:hypothetical protein
MMRHSHPETQSGNEESEEIRSTFSVQLTP